MMRNPNQISATDTATALNAHAGSRTRVTSMGGLYDAATLHALMAVACRRAHGHVWPALNRRIPAT